MTNFDIMGSDDPPPSPPRRQKCENLGKAWKNKGTLRALKRVAEDPRGPLNFSEFSRIFTFSTPRGEREVIRSFTRKLLLDVMWADKAARRMIPYNWLPLWNKNTVDVGWLYYRADLETKKIFFRTNFPLSMLRPFPGMIPEKGRKKLEIFKSIIFSVFCKKSRPLSKK